MEATRERTEPTPPPQAASAAAISAVLGDGDILREILLRLDFPTCLVRAAAVSKRWLRHASDPAFLRRFRHRHPPSLLGFYVVHADRPPLRFTHLPHPPKPSHRLGFVPMPQPPELDIVLRRGSFQVGHNAWDVSDYRNGRLLFYNDIRMVEFAVFSPLQPARGTTVLPPLQIPRCGGGAYGRYVLLPENGGDSMSCTALTFTIDAFVYNRLWVHLSESQDGAWGEERTSNSIVLPQQCKTCLQVLLSCGKFYMVCMTGYILGLDLLSLTLFYVKLPDGVEYECEANIGLSCSEGSGFFLIHVKEFQIHVWLYSMNDSNNTGTWKLIDTICLRQAFSHLADPVPTWHSQCVVVHVYAVQDSADYVFLQIGQEVFYMRIYSRMAEKVYELPQGDTFLCPLMMVWPPTFPALNEGHDGV